MAGSKTGAKGIEEHLTKYSLIYDSEKNKVRCKLTGHEMPARSDTILQYVNGKRYKMAAKRATDELVAKNAPHFSLDARNKQLFCALTGRHIVNDLAQLEMHLRGRRYLKELLNWQVAQTRGEIYIPTWKREKSRRNKMARGDTDTDGEIQADMNDDYFEEFGDSDDEDEEGEGDEDEEVEEGSDDEDEFDFAASSEEEADDGKQKNGHSNPKANGSRKRPSAGSSNNGVNSHTDDSHSDRTRTNGSAKKSRKTDG